MYHLQGKHKWWAKKSTVVRLVWEFTIVTIVSCYHMFIIYVTCVNKLRRNRFVWSQAELHREIHDVIVGQGPRLMRHSVPLELFLLWSCHRGWKRVSCCSSVWLSCTWRLIFMFFLQRTCRFCVKIKSQPTLLASGFRQDYAALPFEVSSIFYWWVPDATFLESFLKGELSFWVFWHRINECWCSVPMYASYFHHELETHGSQDWIKGFWMLFTKKTKSPV
jgi:hypothetical protein